ncbi:MAG: transglycosylase SLT domain-containing protein [Chloroflexi bacterium]|nr:transglycosylase SLT domain-containing protein [Chloroflexota bacterium]
MEQALAIYNAVAKSAAGAEWRRAVQSAAHIHYGRGEFEAAAAAMIAFLDSDPPAQERGPALLLLGAAQQQAGQAGEARESLEEYIESDGVATAHAHLKLASSLSADGDASAAIEELDLALTEELPPPQETEALFALARNQEAAGREADALATWKLLSEDAATPFDRGEALWLLATLAGRIGDEQRYQDALVTLALDYPWHPRALESLSRPQLAPVPILSTADRGVVLFSHRSNEQAQETFRISLEEDASAAGQAKGRYYLALLAERAGQPDEALTEYDAALAALEDLEGDSLFGEAAWARALLLESLGRSEEAVAAYLDLGDASPGSERTPEALFRAGLLRFRAGRVADAIFHWTRYLEAAEAPDRARARFWLAQAALAIGDTQSANLHLTEASQIAPWSYFGLRAVAILEAEPPLPLDEPVPETPATDWTAVQTWLASWAGPEDTAAIPKLTDDSPWRRGLELLLAGLQDEAEDQFAALTNDVAGQPWPLYRLARALDDQRQVPAAARAASRLIGDRVDAPPDILRLAYPSDYLDLATAEAEANGFPPLLLLALIRQESFFQPDAESFAGALGLTQVIPTTADEIAGQLNEPDFAYSDLLRPTVSLRFGAHYLGSQLELFAGDIPAALAAYNGGPGNSLRWQEAAAGDPDVLLETIDLSETRAYVQLVLEHYARYRLAYGLAEGPTLPLP